IQHRELRLEHSHLENLVAFLFTAREAFVDRTSHETRFHLDDFRALFQKILELEWIELFFAAMFAFLVVGETQKLRVRNTRHFDRILKRHKDAFTRAFIRRHLEQIPALVKNLSTRDFVLWMSG